MNGEWSEQCFWCGIDNRKGKDEKSSKGRGEESENLSMGESSEDEDCLNERLRQSKLLGALKIVSELTDKSGGRRRGWSGRGKLNRKVMSEKVELMESGRCCCEKCSQMLLELGRLQKTIKMKEKRQADILKELRSTVATDFYQSNVDDKIQDASPYNADDADLDFGSENEDDDMPSISFDGAPLPPNVIFMGPPSKKIKIEPGTHDEEDSQDIDPSTSAEEYGEHSKSILTKNCSVVLTKMEVEDDEDEDTPALLNIRYSTTRSFDKKGNFQYDPIPVSLISACVNQLPFGEVSDSEDEEENEDIDEAAEAKRLFYVVNEQVILFLCTPIMVMSTRMKCLETDCSHLVTGSDYFALQRMKSHVVSEHEGFYDSKKIRRSCPMCGKVSANGSKLRQHMFHEHTEDGATRRARTRIVLCKSCGKSMTLRYYFRHVASHKSNAVKPYKKSESVPSHISDQLSKAVKQRNNLFLLLREGLLCHNGVLITYSLEGFICREKCGVNVSGLDYDSFECLREHVQFCHRRKPDIVVPSGERVCPLCSDDNRFSEVSKFGDHIIQTHSPPAVCTRCWETFPDFEELSRHSTTHKETVTENEKKEKSLGKEKEKKEKKQPQTDFLCSECGQKFLREIALRNHVETAHHPELPKMRRICEICGKQFHYSQVDGYQLHMSSHSEEKPFVCDLCGSKFKNNKNLRAHVRHVHPTGPRLQCEFCEITYKNTKALNKHKRTAHKELVPKMDPEATKKYINLEHRKDFAGPKIAYPCEFCDKIFELKCRLTQHVATAHASNKRNLNY